MKLAIVTATTNPERAETCIGSWELNAMGPVEIVIVVNGRPWNPDVNTTALQAHWICAPTYLGTVAAFQLGMNTLLDLPTPPDLIACLHDDFRIDEARWDEKVIRHFARHPVCGLAGFGGAIGLGDTNLYQTPYEPIQLARQGFRSNLVDAELHGHRSLLPERVACLDGFSQIGRREFWDGYQRNGNGGIVRYTPDHRPWDVLARLGFVHHFYDGALGCLAKRYGWETWYIPLRGQHYGGQTAVGDQGYASWAETQVAGGDHGFWKEAHRIGYDAFKGELPIRV